MTTTNVDICAQAMLKIGAEPIQSFSENTRGASVAGNLYEGIKKSLLTQYPWNFATKHRQLSRILGTPSDKRYSYAYQIPTDCLLLRVILDESGYPAPDYHNDGDIILSNQDSLYARYIYDVGENKYPVWFIDALIAQLAYEFAEPILGEKNTEVRRLEEANEKIKTARNRDASIDKSIRILTPRNSSLLQARFS